MSARGMIVAVAASIAAAMSAACSPAPPPADLTATPPAEAEPTAPTPASGAEPAATPRRELPMDVLTEIEIPAADGLTLRGIFTPGQGGDGAAVLLLHMYGSDRSSWAPFADTIAQSGISSLALDLRGHGQTGGAEDWELAQDDVARAVDWLRTLPGIDPDRVGVAGASIGANLSLVQAAGRPEAVAAVALLSPGLDYFRVKIDGLAPQVGDVPLFLAAAEDDGYSAQTVRILAEEAGAGVVLEIYEGSAHGTDLFSAHPESAVGLFTFLGDSLSG